MISPGNWQIIESSIPDRVDIYTSESEGMICQNIRREDAEFIVEMKKKRDKNLA